MIQIFKSRGRYFYRKGLGLLSFLPSALPVHRSALHANSGRGGVRGESQIGMPHAEAGGKVKLLGLLDSSFAANQSMRSIDSAFNENENQKTGGNLLNKIYNKFAISCKESRIETNTSFYGCFYLGPFEQGESVTIANALRRTLLSDLMGVAITSVEIEGAMHEYASITGVRESVLDIVLNLKEIILKQTTFSSSIHFTPQGQAIPTKINKKEVGLGSLRHKLKGLQPIPIISSPLTTSSTAGKQKVQEDNRNYSERKKKGWGNQVGYLRARGPGVIKASDLKLPPYIVCVDPEQYIATLSDDGVLNMKFLISEGKNYLIQLPNKNADVSKIKRQRLVQQKIKQANDTKKFVRYTPAPLVQPEITSDLPPLAESKHFAGVKRFFNLRGRALAIEGKPAKQKPVFNDALNGNALPIDAVFMPVTKVNYIIEPDEQSNDEQSNKEPSNARPSSDSKKDFTSGSKSLLSDSGHATSSSLAKPKNKHNTVVVAPHGFGRDSAESLIDGRPAPLVGEAKKPSLKVLSRTPSLQGGKQVIADFQNLGVQNRREEQQQTFSNLLVNPILKTQSPSLFLKHGLNNEIMPQSHRYQQPGRENSNEVNFTFLHPTPFWCLQDKQQINKIVLDNTFSDSGEVQSQQEEGQQGFEIGQKQQELRVFGKAQNRTKSGYVALPLIEHVVPLLGQELFVKKNPLKFKIILEIWTNGSIHPRKALYDSFKSMITLFSRLQKVRILGSMLKSERFYNKLIDKKFKTKTVLLTRQTPLISKEKLNNYSVTDVNSSVSKATNNNPLVKPPLSTLRVGNSRGQTLKPKGRYPLSKTITSLQNSLSPAATFAANTPAGFIPTAGGYTGLRTEGQATHAENQQGHLDLITIESLNLSLRSYTCLKRSNINTINDLMGYSKKQLIQIKNFSIHSLEEIQTRLEVFALKLKQ